MRRAVMLVASVAIGLVSIGGALWASRPGPGAIGRCADPHIVVVKHLARLTLRCAEGEHAYPVTFGAAPVGHKQRRGDERTPEGRYRVIAKSSDARFHRFLKLSYPNAADRARAAAAGLDPGGGIGIHGVRKSLAGLARLFIRGGGGLSARIWGPTDGCIGMINEDVEAVFDATPIGTDVLIEP